MNILGNRIKKERENLNLSREDLGKKIGVSYSAIAMYEQGNREPNSEIILKMCEIFNCSIDYLMGKSNFRTNEEELNNYLKTEIKDDLINTLKKLELSKSDLEKAVTAFIENYMIISDNPTVDIYNMEDSIIYFAYELIIKYYFKLINKELSILTYDSNLLSDKQAYFEKAEENAWNKMKKLLEELDNNNTVISNLTSEEKAHKFISNLEANSKFYMCPVYGQISAGQPNWVEENIEGRIPIDTDLMDIYSPEEYFFLRVNGESMNKVIKNGAFALIHKQDTVENGEIAVVLVNGYDATLKKFTKQGDLIILEPNSTDESFETQVYDKTTSIKILGKYVGKLEINK